jgi:hypothetical protein
MCPKIRCDVFGKKFWGTKQALFLNDNSISNDWGMVTKFEEKEKK